MENGPHVLLPSLLLRYQQDSCEKKKKNGPQRFFLIQSLNP